MAGALPYSGGWTQRSILPWKMSSYLPVSPAILEGDEDAKTGMGTS